MTKAKADSGSLYDLLTPELRAMVDTGEAFIEGAGQKPDKPIVKYTANGRYVKGSGRSPNANDAAVIGRTTAYKRTRSFTEWFDAFIPSVREENPNAIIALDELLQSAAKVAQGWKEYQSFNCEQCHHENSVEVTVKPDTKMLMFLIERRVGKAKETQEINIRSEQIVQMLHDNTPINDIQVIDISAETRAARRLLVADTVG